MLISPLWRPFLVPFGATAGRSYADVEDGQLHVRFGFLFNGKFPLEKVESVTPSHWPLWAGVGWRTSFRGTVGLVGTYVNIVEIRFTEPVPVNMVIPQRCKQLYISVTDPQGFIGALRDGRAPAKAAPRAKPAAKKKAAPKPRPRKRAAPRGSPKA
jgi:hypothetical protein